MSRSSADPATVRPPEQSISPDGKTTRDEGEPRTLGLTSATGLVIGSIVGTGVFTLPAVLAAAGTMSRMECGQAVQELGCGFAPHTRVGTEIVNAVSMPDGPRSPTRSSSRPPASSSTKPRTGSTPSRPSSSPPWAEPVGPNSQHFGRRHEEGASKLKSATVGPDLSAPNRDRPTPLKATDRFGRVPWWFWGRSTSVVVLMAPRAFAGS